MHKAILLDLGRVLVHFDFRRSYDLIAPLCAYPAAEIPKRLAPSGLVDRFECGLVEPREFVAEFCRILDARLDYDRFREIWSHIFTHTILPEEMLEGLARRYRLILLSNTNAIHYEMLRVAYAHLLRHFHDQVLSFEVRAIKPQREIFQEAVARAQCHPEECFYTDDIAAYVAAAREFGIDAVQFQSREQLETEMRQRGIEWAM